MLLVGGELALKGMSRCLPLHRPHIEHPTHSTSSLSTFPVAPLPTTATTNAMATTAAAQTRITGVYGLSPLLHSLTATVSSDSVVALAVGLAAAHLGLCDYR